MVITILQDENQKGKFQLFNRIDAGFHKIQHMPIQEDWKLSQAIFMSSRAFYIGKIAYSTQSNLSWKYEINSRGFSNIKN